MSDFLKNFDERFTSLHNSSCEIIKKTQPNKLFWKPIKTYSAFSCGEYILRSSGRVEQTFGGIMSRLWDDPFEWTLLEELSTNKKVIDYLSEVEETRMKGFAFFEEDKYLQKEIQTPEGMKTLFELLLDTLIRAENLQGRAIAVLQMCVE